LQSILKKGVPDTNAELSVAWLNAGGGVDYLPKVLNAKYLIVHKDIKDYGVMRFERSGAHFPMGIKQTRYFGCFWKNV